MRLFIAIDLPKNIKTYLRSVQALLPDAKMSKTNDFHLTLKFLGECDESKLAKIERALEKVFWKPFETRLAALGVFGGKIPRVIWVGVEVPEWLYESVKEIERRMEKLGFPREHGFEPHLTLARVREIPDPQKFSEALSQIKISQEKFSVDSFYLFESRLSPNGATHIKLKKFGL